MAKIVKSIAASCRDSLKMHSVKLAAVGMVAGSLLIGHAAAAAEDFSFINDTLTGLGTAVLGVLPMIGEIVTTGGPVVVKAAVYGCVAAPFVYVFLKLTKHI